MFSTYTDRCRNGTFANKAQGSGGKHSVQKVKIYRYMYVHNQILTSQFQQFFELSNVTVEMYSKQLKQKKTVNKNF